MVAKSNKSVDINYDPDSDGWFDREITDVPAPQGTWESRQFTEYELEGQISQGIESYCSPLDGVQQRYPPINDVVMTIPA